jgi:hypothetical protein
VVQTTLQQVKYEAVSVKKEYRFGQMLSNRCFPSENQIGGKED